MLNILRLNKPNITSFADARNEILSKSNSEWNLFLDNDEELEKEITDFDLSFDCFYLYRKNYFLGQYVGTDKIIRLVKKGTGKFVRAIHEVWIPNDTSKVGSIDDISIVHHTATNLTDYLAKMNKYSDVHAVSNQLERKKTSLFKIIFFPIFKFLVTFAKSKHFVFSMTQSLHSFLSWTKLYFLSE